MHPRPAQQLLRAAPQQAAGAAAGRGAPAAARPRQQASLRHLHHLLLLLTHALCRRQGFGATRAVLHHCETLPDVLFVSHNHSDHAGATAKSSSPATSSKTRGNAPAAPATVHRRAHLPGLVSAAAVLPAGELPVLLAVESARGRRLTVLAEAGVLHTLAQHRLAELQSTGRPLSHFAALQPCAAGELQQLPCGLGLLPLRARHAERCYGLLISHQGRPVLGWSVRTGTAGMACRVGRMCCMRCYVAWRALSAALDAHADCMLTMLPGAPAAGRQRL